MNSVEIVDPIDVSIFQPPMLINEVEREAITSTIQNYFSEGYNLVFLNGESGIGKTTTLHQFTKLNKKDCLVIFLEEQNKSSFIYEAILKDLLIQITHWLGEPVETYGDVSEKYVISKITHLRYQLKKDRKTLYLILDGLYLLIDNNESLLKKIVSLFPGSESKIKLLVSSDGKKLKTYLKNSPAIEMQLPLLTTLEASSMIPARHRTKECERILSTIKKSPGIISNITRILDTGSTIEEIYNDISDEVSPLEIEWQNNKDHINQNLECICLITFNDSAISISDLSSHTQKDPIDLKKSLSKISFISFDENDNTIFASIKIKDFCREKLSNHKNETIEKIISFLSNNKLENLTDISSIYHRENKLPETIKILSHENMLGFVEKRKSLTELVKQLDIGLGASEKLGQDSEILRYAHLKGLIRGIEASKFLKNEINSLLEKDDISGATDLAMASRSNEEKLQLLALIVKHQKDNGRSYDTPITSEMKDLMSKIDPQIIGLERAMEIALEIFPVLPEDALELITKADPLGFGGANNPDYAFFRFSLSSLIKEPKNLNLLEDSSKNLSEDKRKIIDSLKLFKRGTPAETILKEFNNEKSPGNEILILRTWISSFPKSQDNHLLINRALELALATSTYTANASFFFDLMAATCQLESIDASKKIYERISSQVQTAKNIGPTADYIRLQLEIYKYERNKKITSNRLVDTLNECLNELEDKSISLLGICLIDKFVQENDIRIRHNIAHEKDKLFNLIVNETADQFEILKDSIKIESTIKIKNAMQWAERLNIKYRIHEAYELIVSHTAKVCEEVNIEEMCDIITKIKNEPLRKKAATSLLKRCIKMKNISQNEWRRLIKLKNKFTDYKFNCEINISLLKIIEKVSDIKSNDAEKIKQSIKDNWGKIDGDWKKVDLGFFLHSKAHSIDENLSSEILKETLEIRGDEYLYSDEIAQAHLDSVDLALRVLNYMIREKVSVDKEIEKIIVIINGLPRLSFRIRELSRLCSALQNAEKADNAARIIELHILKEIEKIEPRSDLFRTCFYWAAPIIAKYNLEEFKKHYSKIEYEEDFQDMCIYFTFNYFFEKIILGDPFDPIKNYKSDLSFKCLNNLLTIISLSKSLNTTYILSQKISKVIIEKYYKDKKITGSQYRDLKQKFEKIINEIIKPSEYINHSGYFICAKGLLYDLEQCKDRQKWINLIEEAEYINNNSDRAFIFSSIAEICPVSFKDIRSELYKKSLKIIENLPSALDKINRYEDLSEKVRLFDKTMAKECIKQGLGISTLVDTDDIEQKRRSLIDIAYSMDNEYGESLSTIFDSDPAKRSTIEENIKRKKEDLRITEKMNSDKDLAYNHKLPSIAWKSLGKLNANNMKIDRKNTNYMNLLKSICLYDPHDMYALVSFYIATLSISAKGEENARKILYPVFNTIVSNIGLFLKMYKVGSLRLENHKEDHEQIVIEPDRQDDAVNFLKSWISRLHGKTIYIVDKYFHLEDLSTISKSINNDPNYKIKIFTVQKREEEILNSSGSNNSLDVVLEDYWKTNICSESIPEIHITFASIKGESDEEFPLHDRWWLSDNGGIRLGTSINSLGRSFSEISVLTNRQYQNIEQTIGGFLDESQREIKGKKIRYKNYKI